MRRRGCWPLARGIGTSPRLQIGSNVFVDNRIIARTAQLSYFGLEFDAKFDFRLAVITFDGYGLEDSGAGGGAGY